MKIESRLEDIRNERVNAIVNAATQRCSAAEALTEPSTGRRDRNCSGECRLLGGCLTGEARITSAYRLPAHYIVHTVGPIWHNGSAQEPELLRNCYEHCLRLAAENAVTSINFPTISTGAYRFPPNLAAIIAVKTLQSNSRLDLVRFIYFDRATVEIYERLLSG